ncbi:hypothetical protein FCH28_03085 [Streptomyces piniterrae]|uniref:Uncharacterized protein n=1 Tax=Streptomyces piniterrae TaxID=2571125 RepID=A0A4U0NY42_9ACTN|nr:hypothetical protein [Streptomyces piniterrae]TJZ59122.1 hypothetical protein FCH28_03085 [Streptomyces piniterrae]
MSARVGQEQAPTASGVHHEQHLDEQHPCRGVAGRTRYAADRAGSDPHRAEPDRAARPGAGRGCRRDHHPTRTELAAARAEARRSRVTAKQRAADKARTQLAQDIGRALSIVPDARRPTLRS